MLIDDLTKKILVIDDEEGLVENLWEILSADSHSVVTAKNGSEGVFKIQNQSFDLVITDLNMPRSDGISVIESIRSASMTSHIPIIVISGNIDQYQEKIEQIAGVFILEKPFKPKDIKTILTRVFAKSEQELKLSTALVPAIMMTAQKSINDLLNKYLDNDLVITGPTYDSGPLFFKSFIGSYQDFEVNGLHGSIYFFIDGEFIPFAYENFFKQDETVSQEQANLHGMFLLTRTVTTLIAKAFRERKCRVKFGTPHVFGDDQKPTVNLIERTLRYGQLSFKSGSSKLIFMYKYN